MTNFFTEEVTIYNVIPKAESREVSYSRKVIDKCNIQGGYVDKSNGTVRTIANAETVITKSVKHYLPPTEDGFYGHANKACFFTAAPGDFIVLTPVNDEVLTPHDFKNLQSKYKGVGIVISHAYAYLYGRKTDNITMTNA